ncbi:MAG: hypothetical protein K0Q79_2866 [Flavipsychrobacter sp.]|jgi:hypothetical protein|nr:hypothetical protein [Flavipsychrobacter sp.]
MNNRLLTVIFIMCCMLATKIVVAQGGDTKDIIQINGVTMTADSLRAVPYVTIGVKGQNRGVESEYTGVFSIVCFKGDTLQFSALGYRSKEFVVPRSLQGQHFSLIQLMVQDTFYLPETIIKPLPTKEGFDYAFQHWHIPNDQYEIARRNTDAYLMRVLAYTTPISGPEAQGRTQRQMANDAVYYGQMKPQNILNPIAWGEFFEAWKRGDFRRKNNFLKNKDY